MPSRILLCGDVLGRFAQLFKRIVSVHKNNGPFDAVLCVGQFFPLDASEIMEMMEYIEGKKEILLPTYFIGDYGEAADSVLSSAKSKVSALGLAVGEITICKNLFWLKGSGVCDLHGLRIAYIAGKYDESLYKVAAKASSSGVYHEDDVDALRALADDSAVVDLFLSNEWPRGILNGAESAMIPSGLDLSTSGSSIIAELAMNLKPRYHIAGSEGVFYTREPYKNQKAAHVTRFIGLAAVGNNAKQKFLHALSLTSASALNPEELAFWPPNCTSCPYKFEEAKDSSIIPDNDGSEKLKAASSDLPVGQYWRFDAPKNKRQKGIEGGMNKICFEFLSKGSCSRGDYCNFKHDLEKKSTFTSGACFDFVIKGNCERGSDCRFYHDEKGKKVGDGGDSIPAGSCFDFYNKGKCDRGSKCRFSHDIGRGASFVPSESCWFCLASPKADAHLVVSVGDHCYCALAKGAIVQDHVLIVPIEHFSSTISLPQLAFDEQEKYKESLRKYFKSKGNSMLVFERCLQLKAGTHAHLQVVPIPFSKVSAARTALISAAKDLGFDFDIVHSEDRHADLKELLKNFVHEGQNYFLVEIPEGTTLLHPVRPGEKIPLQLGREVAAKVLGFPERSDWRLCQLSKEEEITSFETFKEEFRSFDPFINDN